MQDTWILTAILISVSHFFWIEEFFYEKKSADDLQEIT